MLKRVLLVALVTSLAFAAPPPKPKPGMSKEQEALLKEADALVQSIDRKTQGWRGAVKEGDMTREQYVAQMQKAAMLYREPAEMLTRLAKSMSGAPREQQDMVGLKAAKAWNRAREPAKALPFCDEVARRSQVPQTRVDALFAAIVCHAQLKQHRDIPALLERAKKELPRLGQKEREAAEEWMKQVASFAAAANAGERP